MEIKDITLGTVLCMRKRLTIPEVGAASVACCRTIQEAAEQSGLDVAGPWHFIAHGLPQDTQTKFEIEFTLPVSGECHGVPGDGVELKESRYFRCASTQYSGSLSQLFEAGYQPLLQAMADNNCALTGESREIYHQWHGPESAKNVIEIQFGIRE
ncbi:hypothetical protein VV869_17060 [Photobacterium sp. MCCC 1A19761]|uniref:hypothetical protein n=1 Tax=Photobacterium sp. MCCC 1A19761 TaxID=3115000 RepID=UPI00307CE253